MKPKLNLKQYGDGMILYSRNTERLYRLNSTATCIWSIIERHRNGLTISQIHDQLQSETESLDLSGPGIDDTFSLVETLAQLGLLERILRLDGDRIYKASNSVATQTDNKNSGNDQESIQFDPTFTLTTRVKLKDVLTVYFLFTAIDCYLKLAGFNALLRRVQHHQISRRRSTTDLNAKIAALDHAQVYYPKKQMCLQRSAALTWLLRSSGQTAHLVIGTKAFPPKGHAWVEVENQVIGDSPRIKALYRELLRV